MGHCGLFVFSECCKCLRSVLSRGGTGSHLILTGSLWLCVENGLGVGSGGGVQGVDFRGTSGSWLDQGGGGGFVLRFAPSQGLPFPLNTLGHASGVLL